MNEPMNKFDYDRIIHQARMKRSIAVGDAIANVIAALSRGFDRAFATVARAVSSGRHGHTSQSKTAHH